MLSEFLEMVRLQAANVAVINDNADLHRLAYLVDVRGDAVLVGLRQVMWQQ